LLDVINISNIAFSILALNPIFILDITPFRWSDFILHYINTTSITVLRMSAHTSTSSRSMSLSSEYTPRLTPSSSPTANSGIRKTTIDRSPRFNPYNVRLPKSFTKSRRNTTKLYEAKIAELLEENNVLKNWWAIDIQDRPEIQEHNPGHRWRKSEAYFREPQRQASALIEQRLLRPGFDDMIEMRNEDYRRTIRQLAATRAQLDEVNAARSQDLDMLEEAIATRKRESQQHELFNEQLNKQLDEVEAERDELAKRVEVLERVRGLKQLGEKLKTVEDALAIASEHLEMAQKDSTLARIRRVLADRPLR